MNNDYLEHFGVKGMRWGVRRTPEQLGHKPSGGKPDDGSKPMNANDYRKIKKTVDSANSYVNAKQNSVSKKQQKERQKEIRKEIESLSDNELKDIVNRLNMEERYYQIQNSRDYEVGKSRVNKILENAGTALTVGSSVLSIMIALKELQG